MRRTTIRLDDELFARAKHVAASSGRTLQSLIEDALRMMLARPRSDERKQPVRLPTFKGDGLQPGVDLDDSVALLDAMEARHHPSV